MRTALVAGVIVAMAVTSAGLWQTPTYEASAQVWVSWQQEGPWQTLEYREPPPTQEIMHTIGIGSVAQEAIQRLELKMDPDELSDNLTVDPVENTSFIVLTYEDTDPESAQRIANTVGEVFSELFSESSRSLTAKVYEEAVVPDSPVSPLPGRNGLLTLAIGLMFCASFAFTLPRPLAARVAGTLGVWAVRQRVGQAGAPALPPTDPRAERIKEKELLQALGRCGKLTAVEASLETSLSVEEANRILSELAHNGHLEVGVEHGHLTYSFWGKHGA
jgi:capsular polysaccharide biosynthesis protein